MLIRTDTHRARAPRKRRAQTPEEILDTRRARLTLLTRTPSFRSLRALAYDLVDVTGCSLRILADMLDDALALDDAPEVQKRPQRALWLVLRYEAFQFSDARAQRRRKGHTS
jgi:hypothetical protein